MLSEPPLRERWVPVTTDEQAEVLNALDEVLESPHFKNSRRYPALLRYIVEQTLHGHGNEIKERTVGIEVFGRAPDYDTNLDTVVRYSAGEVRKRLALYYHEVDVPIQISLSARSYRPEFLRKIKATALLEADAPEEETDRFQAAKTSEKNTGKSRRWVWGIAACAAMLLVLILGRSAYRAHTDVVGEFWSPLLDRGLPTVISLGGVVFSPHSSIGTEVASTASDVNPYLSFENGLAMGRVAALLNARGGQYRVEPTAYTTLAQIRDNPVVFVGAYNNPWSIKLLAPLRFHFTAHPEERIVDSQDATHSWQRDKTKPFGDTADYGLVARFRNPSTNSIVVVLAGIQRFGTDAASQFVVSRELLEEFNRRAGPNWRNKNFEVVLRVDVLNGRTGAPTIEAIDLW